MHLQKDLRTESVERKDGKLSQGPVGITGGKKT